MYLRPRSKVFKDRAKLAKLLKLARSGKYSAPKLARLFNCNKKTVFKALEDNKITLPNLGYFSKRNFCNEIFFDQLDPISSYWLGFIAADGCLISRDKGVVIGLALKDKGHLQKFKKAIKTNAKISYSQSNNSVRIGVYSEKIFNRLKSLGIFPNKSLTIRRVMISKGLAPHFVRGVFDGDGWISGKDVSHVQFAISGNKAFLEKIQNILINSCAINRVKVYPLTGKTGAYKLQYTGFQIFRILEFLYQDSTPKTRLTRKYKKYLEFRRKFLRH